MNHPLLPDGLRQTKLDPAWEAHPANLSAWQWPEIPADARMLLYSAQKGKNFGNHFHTGSDPDKNPETLILVSGLLQFDAEDTAGNKRQLQLDARTQPQRLDTSPYIYHSATALEDCIFIEYETGGSKTDAGTGGDYHSKEEFEEVKRTQ